jgi:hypothetical protein
MPNIRSDLMVFDLVQDVLSPKYGSR